MWIDRFDGIDSHLLHRKSSRLFPDLCPTASPLATYIWFLTLQNPKKSIYLMTKRNHVEHNWNTSQTLCSPKATKSQLLDLMLHWPHWAFLLHLDAPSHRSRRSAAAGPTTAAPRGAQRSPPGAPTESRRPGDVGRREPCC